MANFSQFPPSILSVLCNTPSPANPQPRVPVSQLDWEPLARSANYRLQELANASGHSLRTLQRHVAQRFGVNLHAFISELRMKRAAAMLATGASVKEVGIALGFKQTSHFIRMYRATFGVTPGMRAASAGRAGATDLQQRAA